MAEARSPWSVASHAAPSRASTRTGRGLPVYEVSDSGPDHSKRFHATVIVGGSPIAAGDGSSKKQAEMAAALAAWAVLQRPKR